MNCDWQDIPDSTDSRGWRRVKCLRCGRKLNPTPHEHCRIFAECSGIPRPYELGHWLAIALEVFGITKARYTALRLSLGLQKPCGCYQREATLNTFGARLRAWFGR